MADAAFDEAEVFYAGTALEPFIQKIKQKIGSDTCSTYIFEAPNPTLSQRKNCAHTSGAGANPLNPPSVDPFKAWGCSIVVLSWQTFFSHHVPDKFRCVKGRGRASVVRNGWYSKAGESAGASKATLHPVARLPL